MSLLLVNKAMTTIRFITDGCIIFKLNSVTTFAIAGEGKIFLDVTMHTQFVTSLVRMTRHEM